jgi:hypothetical protein
MDRLILHSGRLMEVRVLLWDEHGSQVAAWAIDEQLARTNRAFAGLIKGSSNNSTAATSTTIPFPHSGGASH